MTLIENLLKKGQGKNTKICDTLCQKLGIPIDSFPVLVESKKRNAVSYFLGNYLKNKPEDPQYWGLDQVEDLLKGINEYLIILIDLLYQKGRLHEAKGVLQRHGIKSQDFPESLQGIAKDLDNLKYDNEKDYKPEKDLFEPKSQPPAKYLRLPVDLKVEFIGKSEDISKMKVLIGQKFIGVDSEWRPQITRWTEMSGPSIIQLGGKKEAFVVDLLNLK